MPKSAMPEVIKSWPTLLSDPLAAAIAGPSQKSSHADSPGTNADDTDDSNVNSILAVTDNIGCIHFFLDGNYPLGVVSFGRDLSIPCLVKDPKTPRFYAHPRISTEDATVTDLQPVMIDIPLLSRNDIRAMANLSTTASELMWYIMRVVKEMRHVWFGSDTHAGARELGPKWIRALETKQKDQFGRTYTFISRSSVNRN
jgi:anaphase-promoting complex subunit 4